MTCSSPVTKTWCFKSSFAVGLCFGSSLKPLLKTSSSSGLQGGEGGGSFADPICNEKQKMTSLFTLLTKKNNCSPNDKRTNRTFFRFSLLSYTTRFQHLTKETFGFEDKHDSNLTSFSRFLKKLTPEKASLHYFSPEKLARRLIPITIAKWLNF